MNNAINKIVILFLSLGVIISSFEVLNNINYIGIQIGLIVALWLNIKVLEDENERTRKKD